MSIFENKKLKCMGDKEITIKWYRRIWWKIYRVFKNMWRTRFGYYTVKHWYERARYGYSYRDTYSVVGWFRDTLPEIMSDLEELIFYKHGIPMTLSNKYDELNDDEILSMKFSLTERIIKGIESYKKWEDLMYDTDEEREQLYSEYETAMQLFTRYLGMFWD